MKCTICYEAVSPAAFRCAWCGSELPRTCGSCGKAVPPGQRTCPSCGFEPPVAAAAPESTRVPGCPWEDRSRPLILRWGSSWTMSQLNPDLFFRTVPIQGGHGSPFVFFVLNHAVYAVANLILSTLMVFLMFGLSMGSGGGRAEGIGFMIGWVVGGTIMQFMIAVVWLYVGSAIYHVGAMLVGSRAPFERTLRVLAFSSAPVVWSALPYMGGVISLVWTLILYVFGFRRLHGLTTGRAVAAALLPAVAAFLLCGIVFFLIIATILSEF